MALLEQEKELRRASGPAIPWPVFGIVLLLAAAAGFFWWQSQQMSGGGPTLTEEAKQYLPSLDLAGVEMEASEDFLEQTLVTIQGKIVNNGDRTLSLVEVNCVFREVNGIEISRERGTLVGSRTGPLHPGETQHFRLPFDAIPEDWNQTMPNLFISQIQFE
ncbi:MAG: FxLYD domain-containing protein [Acidobacteria bacterium]|nr:FxLYD domain-containing protein [Acidobacteriota bacterium]